MERKMPQEFGACLTGLLAQRKVSASELSRMLACKSRNTIFRVLDGSCGQAARQAFYDRLISEDPLALTQEERARLEMAMEVSRVGAERFLDNQAMERLFLSTQESDSMVSVFGGSQPGRTLEEVLSQFTSCKEIHVEISACCRRSIMTAIRRVFLDGPCADRVRITHYVYTGPEEIIENLAAIQPVLYAPQYTAYSVAAGVYSPERERIYRSNAISVQALDEQGKWYENIYILCDKNCLYEMGRRRLGGFMVSDKLFSDARLREFPIKSTFALSSPSHELLAYTQECLNLEAGRAICTVKLDMPISYIHPDLLVSAIAESFAQLGFASQAELDALVAGLYATQLARWENYFTKRRPTINIFSREAMQRFALTGCQSDHFFALRPYTPQERVTILSHIRDQAAHNPNFSVYFFGEGVTPPDMEIGLYEGVGVLLAKPFTHYNLGGDHAEAIIAQSDFCQRFKAYFNDDLLKRRVLPVQRSLAVLDELIDMARHAQ